VVDAVVGKQLHMVLHEARVSAILTPRPLAALDMKKRDFGPVFLWGALHNCKIAQHCGLTGI